MESDVLGKMKVFNRSTAFYKVIPKDAQILTLAKYGISDGVYKESFLNRDPKLCENQRAALLGSHPNREALEKYLDENMEENVV